MLTRRCTEVLNELGGNAGHIGFQLGLVDLARESISVDSFGKQFPPRPFNPLCMGLSPRPLNK